MAVAVAMAGVASAQRAEPVFTVPPAAVLDDADVAPRSEAQQRAEDAIALFRSVCADAPGETTAQVDRALAAGLRPHAGEGGSDADALLGGSPGQVFAPPGRGAVLQVALAENGRCTVWAERAEGPAVKAGFAGVIDTLRARGAKVRVIGERIVERGGSWRQQSAFEVRDEHGARSFDAVTLLAERPGMQVLSSAPRGAGPRTVKP